MNQDDNKEKKESTSFFWGLINGFFYFYSPFAKKIKSWFLLFYNNKYDIGFLIGALVGMLAFFAFLAFSYIYVIKFLVGVYHAF
jgi:hypothetical protein